jgi:outer membrane protein assembly factor BamB
MTLRLLILIFCYLFMNISVSSQNEWPQFRGPEGTGICLDEQIYPISLDAEKNMIWAVSINTGLSSPVISGERIFLTAHRRDTFEVFCHDLETGALLWKTEKYADTIQRFHPVSSAAAPTVATDGEHVVAYFGSYGLICLDTEGLLLWERRLPLQGNMYGVSVSPVFIDGKLVFSRDNDVLSYLEVINPATGETIWRADRPTYKGNWSTPGFCKVNGRIQVLIYGVFSMKAYDLENGEEMWVLPKLTDEPATTPLFAHDLVYVTTYNMKTNPEVLGLPTFDSLINLYDKNSDSLLSFEEIKSNKSILSRYDADGEGDHPLPGFFRWLDQDRNGQLTGSEWTKIENWIGSFDWRNALIAMQPPEEKGGLPKIIWEHEFGVPECPSPIIIDSLIYMVKNGGIFSCLNAISGELVYQKDIGAGGPYYASPVYADGKIYLASTRGVVTVIKEGPDFKIISQTDIGERIMATPALVKGKVILRSNKALYAFEG